MKYLLLLIFSASALACPQYERMKSGDQAKCPGHFFNDTSEKKIRDEVHRSKLKDKQLELKDLQLKATMDDSELWKKESKRQAEIAEDRKNDLRNGVIMGIGGTILGIIFMKKATK